ncbi:MAG: hydratase [Lachnospiraceae bacterium]
MIEVFKQGAYLLNGNEIVADEGTDKAKKEASRQGTIAYSILKSHNTSDNMEHLKLKFDSLASHDITFVGIVQTAKASGMTHFPIPYVLTNCHNSLCAVGGTINEDDHIFGLTAAKHYGGIFVPPHIAVIHQYMREQMAGCGRMILGSDSHTRYGALGTMAIGEGGGELVKQLLCDTYDVDYPDVVAIYLEGKPRAGVGPHDVALAIIKAVFKNGYVKNKVMEFVGPGVSSMDTDYRNGVDVMTTETTCLSSIWRTDEDTRAYLTMHGRAKEYRELNPQPVAYYDGVVKVNLSEIKPMIALPFHPSNAFEIDELNANLGDILREVEKQSDNSLTLTDKIKDGALWVQQGIIAGCAGGNYSNVMEAAHILKGKNCGNDVFSLAVYPSSQPVFMDLVKKRAVSDLMAAGATIKTAFCGPCFGAGDTPANQTLSIRHTTRNFPNREGSKPGNGQMAAVALMDARSIAATAANGGKLTSAEVCADGYQAPVYEYDGSSYASRVYQGFGAGKTEEEVIYGPNIKDWPAMSPLADHILLKVCSKILDEVTTTDELIPSGETSSYRSNPLGLAEFTLSRRDPEYVNRAKEAAKETVAPMLSNIWDITGMEQVTESEIGTGSVIYARKPGDGSAREQAASCQRVLGGAANIAGEYATKRYRSNMINWGMLPFLMAGKPEFEVGDYIFVPNMKALLDGDMKDIPAYILRDGGNKEIQLSISAMTAEEKEIIKAGCLINYNRNRAK